ncbi:MAG: type I methionyl aminopeptidase [bacterium]|nr:type I methionyl aminopeptidase [bacterium]
MIYLKTPEEIIKIKKAGQILAVTAKQILDLAQPGVKLKYLDTVAKNLIEKAGGEPAFLNYFPYGASKPYLCSLCTSVNDVVVHGTPGEYKLKNGDILKLDFGVRYDGYNADAAWTAPIGSVSPEAQKLIDTTREALNRGIKAAEAGRKLGDIGYAIESYTKSQGFKVIEGLTGHGIGKEIHEDPVVMNEGKRGTGLKLEPGLVIAIEPMISIGASRITQLPDDSYATADGSLSAHFEHTIAITESGTEILTEFDS